MTYICFKASTSCQVSHAKDAAVTGRRVVRVVVKVVMELQMLMFLVGYFLV